MMLVTRLMTCKPLVLAMIPLLFLGVSLLGVTPPSASAHASSGGPNAYRHTDVHSSGKDTFVSCSGSGCNHLDPYRTGCAASGYPVATVSLGGGNIQGWVSLMYSSTCQTNWDETDSGNGVEYLAGCVSRAPGPDGPNDYACFESTTHSWINTDMLWSPHNLDVAAGCFVELCRGGPNGRISGYYIETSSY